MKRTTLTERIDFALRMSEARYLAARAGYLAAVKPEPAATVLPREVADIRDETVVQPVDNSRRIL